MHDRTASQSVLHKSARGAIYGVVVSALTIVLGGVRSVLLMRLLMPDQFGFVGLALFFMTFLTPFATFGIDRAIIQRQELGRKTLSTHFVLRLTLGGAVLGVGILASPLLRRVYVDQEIVVDVFLVLLLVNLFRTTFSTPGVVLQREMRFGALAILNLLSSLAMTITAPLLAYLGAGFWSLVAEQAVGSVVRWIGLWVVLRPWRLSLGFDWQETKSLLAFGQHVLSSHLLGILLDRFDDFWVGTALGPTALGYYSRAYEIAQYPERVLATPVTSVFFPTYAALRSKRDLSKAFFRASSFLVRTGFLVTVALATVAPEAVEILFGETWLPIVPVFRLMVVYVMLDPLYVNLSKLITAVGRPEWLARVRLVQVLLFVVMVITAAQLGGINGVALAADLMMLSGTVMLLVYARRFVLVSLRRMFFWPSVAAAAAAVVGYLVTPEIQSLGLWWSTTAKLACTVGTYLLGLYLAERDIVHDYGSRLLRPLGAALQKRGWAKWIGERGNQSAPTSETHEPRARLVRKGSRLVRCPPVIIIGMHRSGTSLIAEMLRKLGVFMGTSRGIHEEARYFFRKNQWIFRLAHADWDNPAPIQYLLEQNDVRTKLSNVLVRDLDSLAWVSGFWGAVGLLRSIRSMKASEPWGWKDPKNSYTLPIWLDIFPQARVIHVYRNGVDVASSLVEREQRRKTQLGNPLLSCRCLELEGAFTLWAEYVQACRASTRRLPPGQISEICYEDYLARPDVLAEALAELLELDVDPVDLAKAVEGIQSSRAYAFADDPELSAFYEERRRHPLMRELGYDSIGTKDLVELAE